MKRKLIVFLMSLMLALSMAAYGDQWQIPLQSASQVGLGNVTNNPQVILKSSTPGTAQTGNLNISGTAIAGAFSGPLTGAVTGNASTASSLINGGYLLTGGTTTTSTPTPAVGAVGQPVLYALSAQGGSCTWGAPTGTPQLGQVLKLLIISSSAQTMAWTTSSGGYKALTTSPGALPTTSLASSAPLWLAFTFDGTNWDYIGTSY